MNFCDTETTMIWEHVQTTMDQWVKNPPTMQEKRRCRFDLGSGGSGEKKWQPIPVFLPGTSHGQRSLAGYHPWGHKESDKSD